MTYVMIHSAAGPQDEQRTIEEQVNALIQTGLRTYFSDNLEVMPELSVGGEADLRTVRWG
jgi:hypothetical protein